MVSHLLLVLVLLGTTSALKCQYQTDSSCTAAGCSWTTNQTCVVGNGNCQDNQVYYQDECVTCSSLATNNCSQICTLYYFSTSLGCASCTNINSNCLTCSPSQCYSCSAGFSVDLAYKTECLIDQCKIRYCKQCDSNTTCYLCSSGFTPGLNQTYCSISSCKVNSCLYCSNDNTCITCVNGYLLSKDSTTCTLICNDPYCGSCLTYSTCTACKSGYEFSKVTGYCVLSCDIPFCSTCDLSTTCTGCNTGYKLSTDRNLCFLRCSDTNCASCSDPNVCKTCALGYTLLSNGTCEKAICYIDSCLVCNNSLTCAVCSSISQLQTTRQQCRQNCLKESYNQKCKTCKDNTTCQTCTAGYSLNQTTSLCYPVCKIDFCVTCLTSNLCSFCSGQYSPSAGGTKCDYECGILNCKTCNSSKTCQTCNEIYTLSTTATSCDLACSPGSYPDFANAACKTCTSLILNCGTCFSLNSTLICSACYDLYYLTSNGACRLCSNVLSNCLLCLNPTNCISCASGFNLVYQNSQYQCVLPYTCNVTNCLMCNSNNPKICTTCENGYYLTNSNLNCTLITCVQTQYYDPDSGTCKCRVGTYVLNNVCTYCNLDNCMSCNNGGCISCKARYYANSGQCYSCMSFCINCTTGKTCLECDHGFEYQDDSCISRQKKNGKTKIKSNDSNNTSQTVICPPGCEKCTYYLEKIYCTSPMSGYAIDSNGDIVRCSDECATCASLDYKICTSCYGSSVLKQGTCIGCSDTYALTCPKNVNYAATCKVGYTPKAGKCQKCTDNCLLCTVTGPSQCDIDGCATGYVNILFTTTCTKCYSSCATCLRHNPGVCLTCGPSNYLSFNSSTCVGCPSNCLSCTSPTNCTSCPSDYILEQQWCYPNIGYPCAKQSRSACTSCYLGYSLLSGVCQTDNTCNETATCLTCPKNYYLTNRRCLPCSITVNCDYCQPTAPNICLQCSAGYYLARSNSSCTLCPSGCAQCISARICISAQTGFYLQIDSEGDYTGKTAKCDVSCAACSYINSCDTCADNYQKLGVACIYYRHLQAILVLGPVAFNGSSSWFKDGNQKTYTQAYAYLNTLQIISAIAISTNTPAKKITIQSVAVGSIVVNFIVQSDQTEDFTSFSANFEQTILTMTQFTLLSKSVVINGQQPSNTSANLGVLLGVTIPLIVLLMIIIIAIKLRFDDSDEKETGQTEKQIQQFEM